MTNKVRYPPAGAAWYAVFVMATLYVFSFLDRQLLVLLVDPIKADIGISDTQISLLTGAAFAMLYSIMGVPFGRAADRFPRKVVISTGVLIWASMTIACGFARSFTTLFIARMGLGVGEAALTPTAHGMMPDLFPPSRLARAMAVFATAGAIGSGLALILGSVILDIVASAKSIILPLLGTIESWQAVFLIVGSLTLVAMLTIIPMSDPPRLGVRPRGKDSAYATRDAFTYIFRNWRAFAPLMIGLTVINMLAYGSSAWIPSYFIRVHELGASETGYVLGTTFSIAGMIGIFGSAWVSDRMIGAGRLDAPLVSFLVLFPVSLAGILLGIATDSVAVAVAGFMVAQLGHMAIGPLGPTALQNITPGGMRSTIAAIWLMVANLLGIGLGPTGVALITDYVFQDPTKVGASIGIFATGTTLIACAVIYAYRRDYTALARETLGQRANS